jgi:hypothetical protein
MGMPKKRSKKEVESYRIQRFVTGSLAIVWLALFVFVVSSRSGSLSAFVLSLLAFIFLAITAISKGSRFSSFAGKILIFIGIFALISLFIEKGLDVANIKGSIATIAIITGIYLEKISPKHQLKKFMILAIAAKVEFVLIAAFISSARSYGASEGVASLGLWWFVFLTMAISVPILAFNLKRTYQTFVWITTYIAFALFIDFMIANPGFTWLALIASTVFLWPVVTERLIGRKVFLSG